MNERAARRLTFIAFVAVGLFAALVVRLWHLQVLATDEFVEAATVNSVQVVPELPTRGRILDRHGVVLADNQRTGVVTVDTTSYSAGQVDRVIDELAGLLSVDAGFLRRGLSDPAAHPLAPKVVATGLDEDGLIRVNEAAIEGVSAQWAWSRTYPHNEIAAHVLGYVGAIGESQLDDLLAAGYLPSERVGRAGIEALFEDELHGSPGSLVKQVDRQGRPVDEVSYTAPEPGRDVVLTIDVELQAAVESYLRQGLISARKVVSEDSGFFFPALAGAAVVIDVRNGDILAMASYPTFDSNWMVQGITAEEYQSVFENPFAPGALNNRAVTGLYSPGSVFKLVTALAGLDAGLISPRTPYFDQGYYTIPEERGCEGRCTFFNADKAPLGTVDLSSALTKSSDAYFYKVADELYWLAGPEQWAIQDTARELGFGRPTGVQLPFEKAGRVPDGEVKRQLFELNPEAYNPYDEPATWFPGDNLNTGIGQGMVAVTPIQLVNAYAAFANGGTLFAPNIVERIASRSADDYGETLLTFEPRIVRTIDFPNGAAVVREGLSGVTSEARRGTARGAFAGYDHSGYAVAGKTGTSQAEGINTALGRKKEDSAVFTAWAPTNDPRYAVVVLMEEAGYGGSSAAPVVRRIMEAVRAYEQRWPEAAVAFVPPEPECPQVPEALRGFAAFEPFVPAGCPWGAQVPRANTADNPFGETPSEAQ